MTFRRVFWKLVAAGLAAATLAWTTGFMRPATGGLDKAFSNGPVLVRILDRTGVIPVSDLPRFEQYLGWVMRESGVDLRFVFIPGSGGRPIETLATELMDELKIGGRTGQQRGVLLLYDLGARRLRVEVGYGLEGMFPDAFVNYLVQDHARLFFSSGDLSLGLRKMIQLLQHRIREAVLGSEFDPRVLARLAPLAHLSGGAGVSATVGFGDGAVSGPDPATDDGGSLFRAEDSPSGTYSRYLDWLSHWPLVSQADLLTPESRIYLSSFRISPAYAEFILLAEAGKPFRIVERGDLALLYFTGTPFVSPHFLVRRDGLWRMDIAAEVRNTHEHAGGEYTWAYHGSGDPYTLAFSDLLTTIKGYRRIRDGDNRALVIRGSY